MGRDPLELAIVSRVRTALAIRENDYKTNNYNTELAPLDWDCRRESFP
jgi:hypothetical protein